MNATIDEQGNISAYKVNMAVTFVLEEGDRIGYTVRLFVSSAPSTNMGRFLLGRERNE